MSVQNRLCHLTTCFGSLALCSLTLRLSCLIQRNRGHGTCVTHTLHTADIRAGLVSFTTFCHYLKCLYENFSIGTTPQKTAVRVGLEDQLQCSTQAGFSDTWGQKPSGHLRIPCWIPFLPQAFCFTGNNSTENPPLLYDTYSRTENAQHKCPLGIQEQWKHSQTEKTTHTK